jgi:phospholipase C
MSDLINKRPGTVIAPAHGIGPDGACRPGRARPLVLRAVLAAAGDPGAPARERTVDDSNSTSDRPAGRTPTLTRRDFLRGAATAGMVAGLGALGRGGTALGQASTLPAPEASGLDHVVVVMMENRSFDHYLGWLDGADGRQWGLKYRDRNGVRRSTFPLAPDFQGCGHPDPDHSYEGGRVELNGGACDGWLRTGDNDEFAIGFYTKKDLAFLGAAAPRWTTCDRYFSSIMAETFPNRFHQHAAQTDRIINSFEVSALPTIWDSLAAAGLDGRYYFSDVPFLALWGTKYLSIARPIAAFLADAAAGTLPAVSFVEPRFLGEDLGTSADDHPHADIRNGQAFLNLVYEAVTRSPAWPRTLLVINYDEWGGFFEHVAPPTAPIPPAEQVAGNTDGLLGFRVPALLVSPFARREHVSHIVFDHASVLRTIEWRWDLPPLTVRDATSGNLAEALDFDAPRLEAKRFRVPAGPFGAPCPPSEVDKWQVLLAMALDMGWPL